MLNAIRTQLSKTSTRILLGTVLALGAANVYDRVGSGDCCGEGAECCYPGSPCCNGHHLAQR
jgi:hypothetical protein